MTKGIFVAGKWQDGEGTEFSSTDPASQEIVWQGVGASTAQVDAAYTAARQAFVAWSETPFETRRDLVLKFKEIALANKDKLAELISRETGKVLWDATGEAGVIGGKVDISLKAYAERTGSLSMETAFGRASLQHRPHGVMAVLGPYNFPAHLPNGQIIPALIAGNTVVYKPSEQCPAVGELMCEMYAQAGFPDGVINMVQGAREVGAAVLDHTELDGVLFTGAASTGAFIHKKFGGRPEIILALEMGGNNPLLLWDVSDAQAAASIIVQSAFITSGQRCTCARRIILPEGTAGDAVLDAVIAMVDTMKIGAWNDPEPVFMGPVISAGIATHIVGRVDELGGKTIRPTEIMENSPAFVRPGIVDVTGLQVDDEEIFGPVMQVIRVSSFEQGIKVANNTRFGLSAGLISDDPKNWEVFARKIHAGVVNFNRATTGASGALPFGGPGASGNHSPGAFYAADFCAWPMASQVSERVETLAAIGLNT
ncbi:MAG: succinylglutamate-semialdehyde dehydrogenase [Robiginitomaculum sp.]|nr:MAG: succinylglutamate-semialdehyde dehydrogenase [Robiginitomaculum sp.]